MAIDSLAFMLETAAKDAEQRPAFFRAVMDATVLVIGHAGESSGDGQVLLQPGSGLSIQSAQAADGHQFIPFFSSQETLKLYVREETRYLALPSRALFEITRGAELVLNPGSPYQKLFTPDEIVLLLTTDFGAAQTRVVDKPTQVLIGQPKNYPTALVQGLKAAFAARPNVQTAWLALMHDPSTDDRPHLLVGIEATGDFAEVARSAGSVITSTTTEPVDVMQVQRGREGVTEHIVRSVEPFYQR